MFHNLPYASASMPPPGGATAAPSLTPAQLAPPAPPPAAPPAVAPGQTLDLSRVPPIQHSAAMEFDSFCDRLTFNSKEMINTLTRVAGENHFNADGIVAVLEQRVFRAPPQGKLPYLYLIDSIIKNIGAPYVVLFSRNLVNLFTSAYAATVPPVRMSMQRLLNTWPPLFGIEMVNEMRRRSSNIDAAFSQSTPPAPIQTLPLGQPTASMAAPGIMQPQLGPASAYPLGVGGAPPVPPPSAQFIQVQTLMNDLTKEASLGVTPSNHKVFNINRLISSALQQNIPPHERDRFLRFQQQLRELSIPQRPAPNPAPVAPSIPPPSRPAPVNASALNATAALSSLLSNPPPGLLTPRMPPAVSQPPAPRAPPFRAVPASSVPAVPRRAPPSEPVFRESMPSVLKYSDIKTMSHAAVVRALYTELSFLSKSDGMRFATQEQLREHLDWIFKRNRSKRAHEKGLAQGGLSRCWYERLDVFLGKDKEDGKEDDGKEGAIPARGASEKCGACGEELEANWDDEQEAWMLKEATRNEEGVFHTKCLVSGYGGGGDNEAEGRVESKDEVEEDVKDVEKKEDNVADVVKKEDENVLVSGGEKLNGEGVKSEAKVVDADIGRKRLREDEGNTGGKQAEANVDKRIKV